VKKRKTGQKTFTKNIPTKAEKAKKITQSSLCVIDSQRGQAALLICQFLWNPIH
jgi:hypothetical protein